MNKKGQLPVLLGFMICVAILVVGLGISGSIYSGSKDAQGSMNCTNSTINDSVKAGCYVTDISPFFFIGGLFALAGIIFAAKFVFGG